MLDDILFDDVLSADDFGDDFGESAPQAKAFLTAQMAAGKITPAQAKMGIAIQDAAMARGGSVATPADVATAHRAAGSTIHLDRVAAMHWAAIAGGAALVGGLLWGVKGAVLVGVGAPAAFGILLLSALKGFQ
jgi:hypothetical protein